MADGMEERPAITDKPKKRKINGCKAEKNKLMRLSSHSNGEDCNCQRFKCFQVTSQEERQWLVTKFNEFPSKDAQDSYLATLVTLTSIARRRGRVEEPNHRCHSVHYNVKVVREGLAVDVPVCQRGFCAIFGIKKNRLETIRQALAKTGLPPKDGRGRHDNRPHKLSEETREAIRSHISSFRGRSSHYCREKTRKLYLPEELNISKMFDLFKTSHPQISVKYETHRKIFNTDFNIGFGYPRKDTCTLCDEFRMNLQHLDSALNTSEANLEELYQKKQALLAERELHMRKAEVFYDRKATAKSRAKTTPSFEAIAFDYQKNLPIPNKTSNDVYYKRQLTLVTFCIHVLSTDDVYLYVYDETIAKKGSDEVASMLFNFINNYLSDAVTDVIFFCDGCAGQNKNYTLIRFFHHLVHSKQRFQNVRICFPIRGHSYLECDRDMCNVNSKADVELPQDWVKVFTGARLKPSPFNVITPPQNQFLGFTNFLKGEYKATCPIPTRPLRELQLESTQPNLLIFRNNWNGPFETAVLRKPNGKGKKQKQGSSTGTLVPVHSDPIPIKKAKFNDLQVLKRLCKPENHTFFDNLPTDNDNTADDSDALSEFSDSD